MMNQMTPNIPVAPQPPIPPQIVKTPSQSWLGWIVGAIVVALAAIALIVWLGYSGTPTPSEPSPTLEGVGNSVPEIQQDLENAKLQDLEQEIVPLEQDAQQVP